MARELRRLLIAPERLAPPAAEAARVMLRREEEHYLARVLRLRPGDGVAVVDGCGRLWRARLGDGGWLEALQACGDPEPAPIPALTLGLALPRQEVEVVWRMATELGIDRLQPLLAERCQGLQRRQPLERWGAIVREATEQCERLWLPSLAPPLAAMPWLEMREGDLGLWATTRREALPGLEDALAGWQPEQPPEADQGPEADRGPQVRGGQTGIRLAIGPEGGWSPQEEEAAERAGWIPITLGGAILRSVTAAVAGVSRLTAWRQLSC